jgi:hypothetical protein
MGHFGQSTAVKLGFLLAGTTVLTLAFRLFNSRLDVTSKGVELVQCCNTLRIRLPKTSQ